MHCKVLSTSPSFGLYVSDPVEYLKSHGCEVELSPPDKTWSEEELIKKARDVDAIIVGFEKMSEPVIKGSRKLKIITKHGAGVDNIDIKAASEREIVVTSAPGANSDAVADLTFGLFLSLARNAYSAEFGHSFREKPATDSD